MPKRTERVWNPNVNRYEDRIVGTDDPGGDSSGMSATEKSAKQSTAGLGSIVKAVRPLRKPTESESAYADRVAAWQLAQDAKKAGRQAGVLEKGSK